MWSGRRRRGSPGPRREPALNSTVCGGRGLGVACARSPGRCRAGKAPADPALSHWVAQGFRLGRSRRGSVGEPHRGGAGCGVQCSCGQGRAVAAHLWGPQLPDLPDVLAESRAGGPRRQEVVASNPLLVLPFKGSQRKRPSQGGRSRGGGRRCEPLSQDPGMSGMWAPPWGLCLPGGGVSPKWVQHC